MPKDSNSPCIYEEGPNRVLTGGHLQGDTRLTLFKLINDKVLEYRVFIKADRVSLSLPKTLPNAFIVIVGADVLELPYTFKKTRWMGSLVWTSLIKSSRQFYEAKDPLARVYGKMVNKMNNPIGTGYSFVEDETKRECISLLKDESESFHHEKGTSLCNDSCVGLIHLDVVMDLMGIVDWMTKWGYEKEWCQVYGSVRRDD
ncbi:hypothetical protein GIB67_036333 [Kingdonia uniflora]|uniref:Uncharacterized protein n=1 Tax=Kingdonia uniflora TaxID=39325 RepID=A0A7J7L3U8_9MAGN|nr:hypothetical protein GIB67_036333 [Kingdonia uniflora]